MHMVGTGFDHNDIFFKNCRNHSVSSPALAKAMNSDSIVERAIHVCLKYFQDTVAPSRVNTYPLVDFGSSESAIQLASVYPSSTGGYCPYLKTYSLVGDTQPNTHRVCLVVVTGRNS